MFWRVAGLLVGVLVAMVLLAVALSAWFAFDQSLGLISNSLRLRFDSIAEEVELRAAAALDDGWNTLPAPLVADLAARFPDPVYLLDAEGQPVRTITPDPAIFGPEVAADTVPRVDLPSGLDTLLQSGDVYVELDRGSVGWGVAPVYDAAGYLAGGLLVLPLRHSIARELEGTRRAFRRALWTVALLAVVIAVLLGAFLTRRLVLPLRRVTARVERIGAGEYTARLPVEQDDEFGRLARAVNQMAADVEKSIEALRAADRLRRELIANVGHDLRTPLAALLGYLEEATRYFEAGNGSQAAQALSTVARQGSYLQQLVADLFELSVLDSGQAPLRREPIPLAELISDAASRHRAAFREAAVTFTVEHAANLPSIEGDGVRLLRVLDNLLSNARQHTSAGGTVVLRTTVEEEQVTIAVTDTGAGIPAEALGRVFERYYRGQAARTRKGAGTGLGLPISRAIALAHGGDLVAESTPGEGSSFMLHLPRT